MPRLNYGTLLENMVVVEATRLCVAHLPAGKPLAFAAALAMPPLTQCWSKPSDEAGSPHFNLSTLLRLAKSRNSAASLQDMWSLCIRNAPNLPVPPYYLSEGLRLHNVAGPNGALLAAMVAAKASQPIELWVNDNDERYPSNLPALSGISPPDTINCAQQLIKASLIGTETPVSGWFPKTLPQLTHWLSRGAGVGAECRVGFLDPDNYAEGRTQVSPESHRSWLQVLSDGCPRVLSVMFSGCQNRGLANASRNGRLGSFHNDAATLFPHSLIFEVGNFQTGVKARWHE